MNYKMTCLITAPTKPAVNDTTTEKNKQQNMQNKIVFYQKIQHLNLKAPSNNVKLQSDKSLATQI